LVKLLSDLCYSLLLLFYYLSLLLLTKGLTWHLVQKLQGHVKHAKFIAEFNYFIWLLI